MKYRKIRFLFKSTAVIIILFYILFFNTAKTKGQKPASQTR